MSDSLFDAVHADPWAEQLVDLPSLNADASSAIEDAVVRQREIARTKPKELRSKSLVIVGPPGAGKTHLFARLRRKLGPKAVFVHVRPLLNSDMTARFVLQEIAKQLGYSTMGSRQSDALVGSLLAHLGDEPTSFPSAFLYEFGRLDESERARRLDEALERVLDNWQDLDESYLRRLLSVPFGTAPIQRAALAWLSGRECDDVQLARLGVHSSLEEAVVVPALRTLAAVASLGAPIVLVFDQLENLIDGDESKSRLIAYANLAAELVDSVRGIVLVHMAIDTEWARGIEPALGLSQRSRVAMSTKYLSLPTTKETQELLRLWAERIPAPQAPFPWPFGERRVARWCSTTGMTPRMLLAECRMVLETGDADEAPPDNAAHAPQDGADVLRDALAAEWNRQLESARRALDEMAQESQCADPARLADGFAAAAAFVPAVSVETNLREPAQLTWRTAAGKLRMAFLHQNHHGSLGNCLSKLAELADKDPVLALRERAREIPPTWKGTLAKRAAFVAKANGRWVPFEREDAARLLGLASLLAAARSGDVNDANGNVIPVEAVRTWVSETLGIASWPMLAFVTGSPDGEVDEPVEPVAETTAALAGVALGVLARLRVASLDRLVREVVRVDRAATRASTVRELQHAQDRVQWVGGALVCMKGDE